MIKGAKNLLGIFGGSAFAPKVGGDRASGGLKGVGGDRGRATMKGAGGDKSRVSSAERADLKQYWKDRAKEIGAAKREDSKQELFERANYFLEREEEMMRAMWKKRGR